MSTKIDIPGAVPPPVASAISVKSGAGLPELVNLIAGVARERIGASSAPAITRERYRQHLITCMDSLKRFMDSPSTEHELRAEDLRQAIQAIGRITGRVDVEELLGEVFRRFCIGK